QKIWLKRHSTSYHLTAGSRIFEKAYVDKIRKLVEPLADPNLIVSNRQLSTISTLRGEVDLAFVDAAHETLLIIEAKCIIPPGSLREERKAKDSAVIGLGQLRRILEWARANPATALAVLFRETGSVPQVKQISGLVVC